MAPFDTCSSLKSGFTLIELSIVLVIIGLIVGGILTGRDLIDAAAQGAQIAQITKYNTAVRTFQLKYGYLPGDIPDPYASNFGFQTRGTSAGQGDGNGVIEGYNTGNSRNCGFYEGTGETTMVWVDLSAANLLDGAFNTATPSTGIATITETTTPSLRNYFPPAKIGNSNYIYAWSGGSSAEGGNCNTSTDDNFNYWGVSSISSLPTSYKPLASSTSISVQQAFNIDKKMDDGLPQSGSVMAIYLNDNTPNPGGVAWAAGGGNFGADAGAPAYGATTAATAYSATNCYDNNNVAGTQKYSLTNASALNCALSFKFQ